MAVVLDKFFLLGPAEAVPEIGRYIIPLVVLSYFVASFASYTAIAMGLQLAETHKKSDQALLRLGGAFSLGAGIWSMHFIGMLSYRMDMVITYDPELTILSMVIAVVLAYGVMGMVGRKDVNTSSLLAGAFLLGLGICLMHFVGMAAMQMDGYLRYKPGLFALSVVIAMSVSAIALYLAFILLHHNNRSAFWYQILAALIMGAAICGMHYTAMLGAVFIPYPECRYDPNQSFATIAIGIALITGTILALSLYAGLYRKRLMERRLTDSEERFRSIMDSALDAIIGMDDKGIVTDWNRQSEILFGWSAHEIIGRDVIHVMVPERLKYIYEGKFSDVLKSRINQRTEVVALNKNNEEIAVESTITTYRLDGRVYYTAFVRDLTERRQSQAARSLLVAIVESTHDPIISKNLNGIVTSWNKAAEDLFGYTAEEAVGCHISLIIPSERIGEAEHIISRITNGDKVEHFETKRRAKDGREIDISLTVSPIYDERGEIIGASKLIRDITERRKTEQALEEANRRRDEFLTNMSHELRTPMNVVVGLTDILGRTEPLTDKQKHFINTLKASADTLLDLINDLLDFSKLEQGAVHLEIINFNLLEMMAQIVSLMNVRAREKKLDLSLNYAPGVPYKLMGDPLRVKQILINIVSNAIKFTRHGGVEVHIGFEHGNDPDKAMIIFTVTDTGIGISAEQKETIFEKFSQADPSITRRYGGTGLGLSIVRELVDRMNGKIVVESEIGKGSRFVISIPFGVNHQDTMATVQPAKATPAKTKSADTSHKGKVLFVEDYGPNTLVGTTLLEQFGYDYDTATNGVQAVERFKAEMYDAVLMDIQMPEMDGLEATRQIRAWEAAHGAKPTPIIAMTAHVLDHSRQSYKDAGMNDFIPKPFDAEDLARKLALYCMK